MKRLILTLFFLLLASSANAIVTDWPHNEDAGMKCSRCHTYSLWWDFSPLESDLAEREQVINVICLDCHDGSQAIEVVGHTSSGFGAFHRQDMGTWFQACADCHDPHFQSQLKWYGDANVPNDELFLVTATINSLSYDSLKDETTITYSNSIATGHWVDPANWTRKSGKADRGLVVALPISEPAGEDPIIYKMIRADGTTITVPGQVDSVYIGQNLGLHYGQLIKNQIDGFAGPKPIKFFNPYGGYVDSSANREGLCQVCHSATKHYRHDGVEDDVGHVGDHATRTDEYGNAGDQSRCTYCHIHIRGLAPGSESGKHNMHLAMTENCNLCHTGVGTPNPLTEKGCRTCHNNGKAPTIDQATGEKIYQDPNDQDYRFHWFDNSATYKLNCNSCHNGRLHDEDIDTGCLDADGATECTTYGVGVQCKKSTEAPFYRCDSCHRGVQKICNALPQQLCTDCHNGTGSITGLGVAPGKENKSDIQAPPVGMGALSPPNTDGHTRLASSKWVRQYACYYCHTDTVDENWNLKSKHSNQQVDVVIDSKYYITGTDVAVDAPYYTYDNPQNGDAPNSCYNVYCHSDGTTSNPKIYPYPWDGGHEECNSCHGHGPETDCSSCHTDDDPNNPRSWADYAEKKWLSAMPMYPQEIGANSHYRHLFTGFSCDDCHFNTIKQSDACQDDPASPDCTGGCLTCHQDQIPPDTMSESSHINPAYHVNKTKDVVFKYGGTYDPFTKSCSGTACHAGVDPIWGGSSVRNNIVCKGCHGATDQDVDDFGKFNNVRAKINLSQWSSSGHGRQASSGNYESGNPAANFGDNGCWYCHDATVLHQNEERPFRLIQHEHFNKRFELECVFCHMVGEDNECLTCHNVDPNIGYRSLAPQLDTITLGEDHTTFNTDGNINNDPSCVANCHSDDTTRHKTGVAPWQPDQKDDVRNAYLQMGVCLKCHDDDSGGQCTTCHDAPANDPDKYKTGFDPASIDPELVTSGRIAPVQAKASSFHFGYKHFNALEASVGDILHNDTVSDVNTTTRTLVDSFVGAGQTGSAQAWTKDQFIGRRVEVTYTASGETETRPIVRNDENTLTVAPRFTNILSEGDTYTIIDVVWKGGKFCWDCHDPHGDENIYMIQNKVATRTDGVVGKPIDRKEVFFTRKTTGLDYARIEPNPATGNYDGICNVCHTDTSMHYTSTYGDNHNSGRVCTECHEHRFTDSHASGQACNTCHVNRPVPRHTAFGQARDCTKCHKDAIKNRMNIMKQFSANSHHVQGEEVTNKHCYACHWEATKEGVINIDYHKGYNYKDHTSETDSAVDLVVWEAGARPEVYDADNSDGTVTAVTYTAKNVDIWSAGSTSTLDDQRAEVDNITVHCLGCHSDKNNDTQPFNIADPDNPDCKTPRQYAWDRSSIEARYADTGATTLGKYSGANVADKAVTKAFSAHGNALAGTGGWSPTTGTDEAIPDSRAGAHAIQCFDCHSSHGSMVEGITSSYVTFNGTRNGANLKETQKGKGGYQMNYMATANPDPNTVNPYQAGAGQCFDCHETAMTNTQISPVASTPWGYNETFGATDPIIGYKDNPRFSGNYSGERFAYRQSRLTMGGHLRASHSNPAAPAALYDITTDPDPLNSANYDPTKDPNQPNYDPQNSVVGALTPINGLCTPCHDPHGLSPTLGAKKAYAVPLLKGTWLSSPYKEDAPPLMDDGTSGSNGFANSRNNWQSYAIRPYPQKADPQPTGVWRTDRNTFNTEDLSDKVNQPAGYERVTEPAETFAGLCLRCHPKASLTTESDVEATGDIPWATSDRIHRAVKGWGWTDGESPREHSFTCSKCHKPHSSGLPRLMQTNCLNYPHRGQQETGGSPIVNTNIGRENNAGHYPYGWYDNGVFTNVATNICHGADTANGSSCSNPTDPDDPTCWPNNQRWNVVTPWEGQ